MILQKAFKYIDLMLNVWFAYDFLLLLLVLKIVVLLNIFVKTVDFF